MSWFKRKTKEEKIQKLQDKVDKLNEEFSSAINHYCKIGDYIFIFKGFKHNGKDVCVQFIDHGTVEGYVNYITYNYWYLKHSNIDFNIAKYQFIAFKDKLEKIKLRVEINEIN